jgi:hypothetical protein
MGARGGTEAVRNVGWIGLAENRGPGPGSQPGKKVAGFWPVRNHTKTLYLHKCLANSSTYLIVIKISEMIDVPFFYYIKLL